MQIHQKAAFAVTAMIAAISGNLVWADCIVYRQPDMCSAAADLPDGFWIGEYSVVAGSGTFSTSSGTFAIPPAGLEPATVYQLDGDLVIIHPQRQLNGDLVTLEADYPGWSWGSGAGAMTLDDVQLTLGCYSDDLPRWIADTVSDDDVPMTLEMVAIDPTVILGRLSAEGVRDGHAFTYERHIELVRAEFPVEGLEESVLSSELCDSMCSETPWLCPDRP